MVGRSLASEQERFELLCNVLTNGVLSHPPHGEPSFYGWRKKTQNGQWLGDLATETHTNDKTKIFENIICFADIPFESLGIHVAKYSAFGLGLNKRFLAQCGTRPVMYFPYWRHDAFTTVAGCNTLARLQQVLSPLLAQGSSDDVLANTLAMQFLAYLKPFDLDLKSDDRDNYYMEREWRKIGSLRFSDEHIESVVIPRGFGSEFCSRFPLLSQKVKFVLPATD